MFEAPDPKELSNLLPGYNVTDLIATGGMGAVYHAEQIALQRKVAIKILPRELSRHEKFEKSFRAEAKAMARLHHPNLIGIHDFGEVDGFLYLIMDFVAGKSLHHSAHGKVIDESESARLVLGICQGMAHAHEQGIIHRDLKPANILLDPQKQPRIGDFGLARQDDDSEGDGMHYGTPEYCAPEVMKGPANADKRSDVFAIGVILYELLTGELPGDHYVPPSQLQKVDPRFDKIVRRAIHPSPSMRFADAGEMAKELRELNESLSKPGSRLVTGAKSGGPSSSRLRTGEKSPGSDPAPAALAHAASVAHSRAIKRNLVIIAILLIAIPLVWSAYNRKKNDLDRQREQAEREDAARETRESVVAASPSADTGGSRAERARPSVPATANAPSTPDFPPEPPAESDLTLSDLRTRLADGSRDRFPAGTFDLGIRKALLIDNPHNWQEASLLAEDHGGHLATITDESVRSALLEQIPSGVTIWLGGGLTGPSTWGWVDGSPWSLSEKPGDPQGRYLSMSSAGAIEASSGRNRFPFVIVWHMNGKNPGSTAAQLTRLKESRDQSDPLYPPGTLSDQDRRYLIMEQEVTWNEAAELARSSGGYLAVPSDEAENDFLRAALTAVLPASGAAWIGGRFQRGAWTWVTGEPWTFRDWAPKPDHALMPDHTALRFLTGTDGGWDNVDPDAKGTAAYLIEWSNDRRNDRKPAPAVTLTDLAELSKETASVVALKRTKHAELILKNGEFMDRDLVDWLNHGLHKNTRAKYAKQIALAQKRVLDDGRIDREGEMPPLPEDIAERCNEYIEKQETIDTQFEMSVEGDRLAFLATLNESLATARAERLLDRIEAFEDAIGAAGGDAAAFLESLSPAEGE